MKAWHARLALALLLLPLSARGQEPLPRDAANLSVRNEVQLAIDKANGWLAKEQHPDGSWSDAEQPALTALALLAILGNPQRPDRPREALDSVRRALEAIRRHAHPDGSIRGAAAPILNTAVSLAALQRANLPEDDVRVAAARAYLVSHQQPDGGFGDLVTTAWVIDTLHSAGALPAATAAAVRGYVHRCERPSGDGYSLAPGESAANPTATSAALLVLGITAPPPLRTDPADHRSHETLSSTSAILSSRDTKQLYLQVKSTAAAPEFALLLINSQTSAGTWPSPVSQSVEATGYGVLTLELLYRNL